MKKIFFLFFSIILFSCEEGRYIITEIGDFKLYPNDRNENKISGSFSLEVVFKTMELANNWNVIPTANAFKPSPIMYLNAINLNSIKVYINKDVKTLDDKIIKAGENLSGYRIDYNLNEKIDSLLHSNVFKINFELNELQKLKFEKGPTKITLTGKNTDNIKFKFEKDVIMDL